MVGVCAVVLSSDLSCRIKALMCCFPQKNPKRKKTSYPPRVQYSTYCTFNSELSRVKVAICNSLCLLFCYNLWMCSREISVWCMYSIFASDAVVTDEFTLRLPCSQTSRLLIQNPMTDWCCEVCQSLWMLNKGPVGLSSFENLRDNTEGYTLAAADVWKPKVSQSELQQRWWADLFNRTELIQLTDFSLSVCVTAV